ncbi:unnamed protein product [Rhizophagus irregularis]|nr:unnamed protein product [Rhizophagus irregularis]
MSEANTLLLPLLPLEKTRLRWRTKLKSIKRLNLSRSCRDRTWRWRGRVTLYEKEILDLKNENQKNLEQNRGVGERA